MSAMSGRCCRGQRHAFAAVGGLGHHLDVVLGVEERAEPAADERLVVDQQDTDHGVRSTGSSAWTVKPPSLRGPRWSCPPRAVTRSRIPSSPTPGAGAVPGVGRAVVIDLDDQRVGAVVDPRPIAVVAAACRAMLVSDSWTIRYAVRSTAAGTSLRCPSIGQHRVQAGRPGPLHQVDNLVEPGRRVLVVVAERVQGRPQFPGRLPAGLQDRQQRLRNRLAPLAGQVDGGLRLHLDHRDLVGERVVQLPGDVQPLLVGAAPSGLLAAALGLLGSTLGLPQRLARRAGGDQPGQREDVSCLRHRLAGGPTGGEASSASGTATSITTEHTAVATRCPARTAAYTATR